MDCRMSSRPPQPRTARIIITPTSTSGGPIAHDVRDRREQRRLEQRRGEVRLEQCRGEIGLYEGARSPPCHHPALGRSAARLERETPEPHLTMAQATRRSTTRAGRLFSSADRRSLCSPPIAANVFIYTRSVPNYKEFYLLKRQCNISYMCSVLISIYINIHVKIDGENDHELTQ